jgi:hypothetical protein
VQVIPLKVPPRLTALTLAALCLSGVAAQAAGMHVLAATAALKTNCSASASSTPWGALSCRLNGFLHILYVAAAVLAVILIAVIAVAFRLYQQNKMTPEDEQP